MWDASIFQKPFEKVLQLNLDNKNSKVINDLFMHLISEMILASCAESKPDLILALSQAPISRKALERLRQNNITTAFWFVEDYKLMEYWRDYAPYYDFYFTIQKNGFFDELNNLHINNFSYLPLAADPGIHRPLHLTKEDYNYFGSDISFMGAGYYNRQEMFSGLMDFDFSIWGNEWDTHSRLWKHVRNNGSRISTEDTVRIFNATKVNLNLHSSINHEGVNPYGDFVNPRTFEIAACNAFQLVDRRSMLNDHFVIGKEIICYSSLEEMREQIKFYLNNDQQAKEIAKRAYERTIKEHTYEKRMNRLLEFVQKNKPEVFYSKDRTIPAIENVDQFCLEHPEVRPIIDSIGQGGSVALEQITSIIRSQKGPLEYHQAIFLLMENFQELFRGNMQ